MSRDPEAHRRKCKDYHYRRHVMGGSTTVPADASREVLTHLAARMSYSAIARALGTSHNYVTKIVRGEIKRVSPERAEAIRRLHSHRPDDTSHVTPLGARRRLQALHALGYSWARIASEIDGYSLTGIKDLVTGRSPVIEAQHDLAIREVYNRLSMKLPTSSNVSERSGITRARNVSRERGWPPPLAWDSIDDPNERPTTIARETAWEDTVDHAVVWRVINGQPRPRQLTRAESAQVVHTLLSRGISTTAIERDYGLKAERYERLGESA